MTLDNFGNGWSPRSLLQSLPLYDLKIDASFIHQMAEGVRAQAADRASNCHTGRNMAFNRVAEGIEIRRQQVMLEHFDGKECQRFPHGHSMPAQVVRRLALAHRIVHSGLAEKRPQPSDGLLQMAHRSRVRYAKEALGTGRAKIKTGREHDASLVENIASEPVGVIGQLATIGIHIKGAVGQHRNAEANRSKRRYQIVAAAPKFAAALLSHGQRLRREAGQRRMLRQAGCADEEILRQLLDRR